MTRPVLLCLAVLLAACKPAAPPAPLDRAPEAAPAAAPAPPQAAVAAETEPQDASDPQAAVVWLHPQSPDHSLLFVADDEQGLETYGLDGRRRAVLPELAGIEGLDLRYGFALAGRDVDLLAAVDPRHPRLQLFEAGAAGPQALADLALDFAPARICLHRSPYGAFYAFVFEDSGRVRQLELYDDGGKPAQRSVREFHVGGEVEACAADDASASLFVAEGATAIWRYSADPEAPEERSALAVGAPRGELGTVKALALAPALGPGGLLLAAEDDAAVLRAWELDAPWRELPAVELAAGGADAVRNGGPLAAFTVAAGGYAQGFVLAGDAANEKGGEAAAPNLKFVPLQALRAALALPAQPRPPRTPALPAVPGVMPQAQTEPVLHRGDAADDPAIWVHPRDPARSLVIATDKKRGLQVYALDGALRQTLELGRINNVDLRSGFMLGGREVAIVAGGNRSDDSLALLALDPDSGQLRDVAAGPLDTGLSDPYGLCLYRSARSGEFYVILNDSDGRWRQWRLRATADARVGIELVREFRFDSQPEGCVADDETGTLFAGEEDVGLWRLGAEPDAGSEKTRVDHTGAGGHLVADVEGMSLWTRPQGRGWLVVSSQGEDAYAVYERQPPQKFVGKFRVVANPTLGIDGASETDGLDLSSANLGGPYVRGLLVVQDGRKVSPQGTQNFKLVPWSSVEAALRLPAD